MRPLSTRLSYSILIFACFLLSNRAWSQVAIGTSGTSPTPNSKAVLLLEGNNQGLILPIVSNLTSIGAASNEKGMVVFNSTDNKVYYFDGASWAPVGSGGTGSNLIQISGNTITLGVGASSVNLASGFSNSARGFLYWNGTSWVQAQFTLPSTTQALVYNPGTSSWGFQTLSAGGGTVTNVTANAPINVATGSTTPALSLSPLTDTDISTIAAISGTKINPAFGAQNITTTTGSASIGGGLNVGLANGLQISNSGNFTRINNIATSFPAAQGAANTYLRNDGSGNLSWSPVAGGSDVTSQSGVLIGNGTTITGLATGANNQVLTVNAGVPTWQNIPILNQSTTGTAATATALVNGRTISLTGDVTYTSPTFDGTSNISANATVEKLQGRNIVNTLPTNGQVLKWNGTLSQWEPSADAVGGGGAPTLTPGQIIVGDGTTNSAASIGLDAQLNSTNGNITVRGLQGRPISNAVPLNNSVYQYDGTQWAPVVLAGITNPMTTPNDLIVGGVAGAATRLAAPGNNQLLSSNGSGAVTWVPQTNFVTGGSQAANLVLASPSGSAGLPIYRQVVEADIAGTIAGSKIVPNFVAQNVLTTGTLTTGTAGAFSVDGTGNITKIRNATTSFPAANAAGVLTNDGSGTLSWAAGTGWGLTGNTLAGTERIGSDNAQPLVLETNNTERMRINPTGIVGIGTTSFGGNSMLYVNGGVQVDAGDNNTGTSTHGLTFGSNNSGEVIASQKQVGGPNQNGLDFYTGFVNRMAINAAGNVGIGTATPLSKLDVVGDMRLAQGTAPGVTTDKLYNVGGSLFWNGTNISSGGSGWGLTGNAGINPATNFIGTTDAQPLRFATGVGGTERMRLDATGNLGFGITAPLSKFHIKQSVQVNDFLTDGGSGFYGAGMMFENNGTTDAYYMGYTFGGYFSIGNKTTSNVFTGLLYASPNGVGIFNAIPSEKLDVTGNVKFSGALMPNNLPGTAGQVLTSAGPGLPPTWSPGGSGWTLGGNTGTVDGAIGTGTNYIGTRDNVPLNLVVNNQRAGRIEAASASANLFMGYQAGNVNTGTFNAAFGYSAMTVNTTGQGNAAVGYRALANNTTGNSNTAMGFSSLSTNTTGNTNTAIGSEALRSVAIGADNTAVGQQALRNATGNANLGIGSQAAVTLTTGNDNAALGSGALFSTTTGSTNTAVGNASLSNNITGSGNTALGYNAEVATGALTNATAIGANSSVTTSNTIQLGDAAVTAVNVGTGTTAKLVAGQLQITGGTLSAGRVLTSDATGNATWQPATGGGWGLSGNAATVDGTNFIGTTDNIPFTIRVNNQRAGRIESATPFATFYGYQAGLNNGAAQNNTAIGYQALTVATSASNTAVGYQAMQNSNGGQNTAVGDRALQANTNGSANTAIGQFALANATSTSNNSAVGLAALQQTSGTSNVALGTFAGTFNSTGATNVFVGYQAGYPNALVSQANTTGSNNTFIGANTGLANSTQRTNATAIGANAVVNADNTIQLGDAAVTAVNVGTGTTAKLVAGQLQITGGTLGAGRVLTSDASGNATWQAGGSSLISNPGTFNLFAGSGVSTASTDNAIFGANAGQNNTGPYNVIIGANAAINKTAGSLNTIVGWFAGKSISSPGDGNTLVGAQAGENTTANGLNSFFGEKSGQGNTTGGQNTFIGDRAGLANTTGSNNTMLGAYSNVGSVGLTNATAIGYQAQVNQSNSLVLGSINGVNGATTTVNVGIGTSTPINRLDVDGAVAIGATYAGTNAAPLNGAIVEGNVGIGTNNPSERLHIKEDIDSFIGLVIENTNTGTISTERISFNDENGSVAGIQVGDPTNASGSVMSIFNNRPSSSMRLNVAGAARLTIANNGNITIPGSLTKGSGTFKIDHPQDPENKYLYHSFVESPEMMNVYNGNVSTDEDGNATVALPSYFESLNKDFRYQLTVIGTFAQAIVMKEIEGNQFAIKTDKPNVKVSWQVTGVRKDPFAEKNRVVPEVEKPASEKGKYLHPEAYGLPLDRGVNHEPKKENN